MNAETWKALGPLVMEEEPAPEPAVVNAEKSQEVAARCARRSAVRHVQGLGDHRRRRPASSWPATIEDEKRDPASTTKMMTAYLVSLLAEKDPEVLDEIVTFSERADKTSGSTSEVKAGEKLPVGELLYGLMLPSGNDASVAFAEHLASGLADEKDKKAKLEQLRQLHLGDESQGRGARHEVDALQQPARLAERRASDDGARSGAAGVRRVSSCRSSESRRHAAARLHARLGDRLQAQHRVAEHEPIVEDRRVRRYKNRHHGRRGQLHRFHRRARRATVDRRRCSGRRRPNAATRTRAILYRWAWKDLVKIGDEGENGQGGFESKLNDESIERMCYCRR